jgi:hypothetical protein
MDDIIAYKVENNIITDMCVFADEETVIAHGFTIINHAGLTVGIGDNVSDLDALKIQKDNAVAAEELEANTSALEATDPESIRNKRNALLAETDWWGLADTPMTAEQAAYRQALRDIPSQEGFPNSVVFPTKP